MKEQKRCEFCGVTCQPQRIKTREGMTAGRTRWAFACQSCKHDKAVQEYGGPREPRRTFLPPRKCS